MKPKKLLIYSVFFNDNVGVLFLCGWLTVSQLTSSPRSAEISSSSSLQRTKNVIIKKKFNHCFGHWSLLLSFCLLLSEDSQDKVGLFAGLKGGGNDDVLSGRKTQPGADFSQVNESLRACARWMAQKEIFLQVDILAASVLWVVQDNRCVETHLSTWAQHKYRGVCSTAYLVWNLQKWENKNVYTKGEKSLKL